MRPESRRRERGRESLALGLETAASELESSKTRLKELGKTRPQTVVEAEIKGLKQDKFWQGSTDCTAASGYLAQAFCKSFSAKQTELAAAVEADRLMKRVGELAGQIQSLKSRGAGEDKDPQASMLAALSGMQPDTAQKALIVSFAFLVELGAAFGLFLATGHSFSEFTSGGQGRKEEKELAAFRRLEAVPIEALAATIPAPRRLAPIPLRLRQLENGALVVDDGSNRE